MARVDYVVQWVLAYRGIGKGKSKGPWHPWSMAWPTKKQAEEEYKKVKVMMAGVIKKGVMEFQVKKSKLLIP